MKLGLVQYQPPKGDPTRSRKELSLLVREAADRGAELIVCPEMATCGYVWDSVESLVPFAEPPEGPTFKALRKIAREYRCWIVVGLPEFSQEPDGTIKLYNSAIVINPGAELSACYRKVLLFEVDEAWATPGDTRYLLETGFARVGVGICMDLNDDQFVYWLNAAGVDVLAFPTNWIDQGEEVTPYWKWRLSPWSGWFVAANRWGSDEFLKFKGNSAIISPNKEVVALAGESGDEVLVYDTVARVEVGPKTRPQSQTQA